MRPRYRSACVFRIVALAVLLAAGSAHGVLAQAAGAALPRQAGEPASAQDAERTRGKVVFDEWCAGCHAPGPRHPGTQALDALYRGKKPGALEARTDLVPKLTETFVRKGVSVMAPFRKTEISDAQLADLAAYLSPTPR